MSKTRFLLLAVLLGILVLIVLRTCGGDATSGDPPAVAAIVAGPDAGHGPAPARPNDILARAELASQYEAAMRAAVSTLHRYLAVLPDKDRAAADAFWVEGEPARDSREADLRDLPAAPKYFRSRNLAPQAIGLAPVPDAVRIPVELRLGLDGHPARRYQGWYELQRQPAGDEWRISNASVDVVVASQ